MTDRTTEIHRARVYLREARIRMRNPVQRGFAFTLLRWAGNCRRRAVAAVHDERPQQMELFR